MSEPPSFNETFYQELRLLLEWRRDVRCFCTDPLPEGLVEELVSLGVAGALRGLLATMSFRTGQRF